MKTHDPYVVQERLRAIKHQRIALAAEENKLRSTIDRVRHGASYIHGASRIEWYPSDLTPQQVVQVERQCDERLLLDRTDWDDNLVVDTVGNLLAALFKTQTNYDGIQYVVVGSGQTAWDTTTPAPGTSQTEMENELGRVAPTISFLDSSNNVTTTVTDRLDVSGTFGAGTATGTWREWGLVGGNATGSADSGLLIDYNTHTSVTKGGSDALLRRVRITF